MTTTAQDVVTRYVLDPSGWVSGSQKVTQATAKTSQAARQAKQDVKSYADFIKATGGDSGPMQDFVRAQQRLAAAMKTGNHAIIFDARHNMRQAYSRLKTAHDEASPNTGIRGFVDSVKLGVKELDSAIPGLQEVLSVIKFIGIAAVGSAVAITGIGMAAMRSAAEFQALELGLKAYSDSTEEFEKNLRRLREVARMPGLGYREAITGSTRLQAAGFDARLAERALLSFGNALAAVGGGKDDLDGIILALSQIATKSSVSAEEIGQIAERVPQIRQAMLNAFGTADSEKLTKLGIGPQRFIMGIIAELERLPKAAAGWKNSIENFGDIVDRITVQIGKALNTNLMPEFDKVAGFLDFLETTDAFGKITRDLLGATQGAKGLGGILQQVAGIGGDTNWMGLREVFKFMGESDSLGGGIVRGIALVVATMERLPDIITLVSSIIKTNLEVIRGFINSIINLINSILKKLIQDGISVSIGGLDMVKIGGGGTFSAFKTLDQGLGFDLTPGQRKQGEGIVGGIVGRAGELIDQYGKYKPSNEIAGDTSLGGFRRTLDEIAENTKKTSEHTRPRREWGTRNIVGGGDLARLGVTPEELSRHTPGAPRHLAKIDQKMRELLMEISGLIVMQQAEIQTAQRRFV